MAVLGDRVEVVRAFNRFWTRKIGVLQAGLLDTPYSLTEARVVFELAQTQATDLVDLRRRLGLDAGYLSRIMQRFRADGLVQTQRSALDARRQVIQLTAQGHTVFTMLNERSSREVEALLGLLSEEDQRLLLAAMDTIQDLFTDADGSQSYALRPLRAGDLGWVVYRHGVLYAEEYAWDASFEAFVARIVADYVEGHDPKRERAWIAEVDRAPVGSVFCTMADQDTAQLRLLLVEPRARGLGIGARLVDECVRFAKRTGYRRITLWTNDVLVSARRIYETAGFRLVDQTPHHSFGHDLIGQHWRLDFDAVKA